MDFPDPLSDDVPRRPSRAAPRDAEIAEIRRELHLARRAAEKHHEFRIGRVFALMAVIFGLLVLILLVLGLI